VNGVEIWGWKERMKKLQDRYLRWELVVQGDAKLHNKEGNAKGKAKRKGEKKGLVIRGEIEGRRG